jgi:hypothetical protein
MIFDIKQRKGMFGFVISKIESMPELQCVNVTK